MSGNAVLELASGRDRARVIDTSSSVKGRNITATSLVDAVGQTITVVGSGSTFANHLVDSGRWARVLDTAIVVTSSSTVVILHQTRVAYTIVCGRYTDTATRFLHHNSQNEAVINTTSSSGFLNTVIDGTLRELVGYC